MFALDELYYGAWWSIKLKLVTQPGLEESYHRTGKGYIESSKSFEMEHMRQTFENVAHYKPKEVLPLRPISGSGWGRLYLEYQTLIYKAQDTNC